MRYLLDTNICIDLIRRHPPELMQRFARLSRGDVAMSMITLAELRHGVERHPASRDQSENALAGLLDFIPAYPFEGHAAASYGVLAATVCDRKRDALDRLIAAHAISLGVILVTDNESDFAGYPGLRIENWAKT